MTVGRILLKSDGKSIDKGSGFVLATRLGEPSRVLLTANHVVRDQEAPSLLFALEDGQMVPVERVERDEDLDVAVLHLSEDVSGGLAVSRAVEGAFWQVDARPRGNDPKLTGIISAVRRPFKNARGHETHIMQLLVEQTVAEYEGYSGSPVVLQSRGRADSDPVTPEARVVIGVLVEQLRWRVPAAPGQRTPPASNVLYAIGIQEVLNQFGLTPASLFSRADLDIPASARADELAPEILDELVKLLLKCPAVNSTSTRNTIVNGLPFELRNTIARDGAALTDVSNIVSACVIYPDGLNKFIARVKFFEGNSFPMQAVRSYLISNGLSISG